MVIFNFLQTLISAIPTNLEVLFEIGMIIILATLFAFLIKILKQPVILGYVLAGIIIGPMVLGLIGNQSLISSLSEIGVAFLIFSAGLEIKFKKLKEVGWTFSIVGILQVLITFFIALLVSIWFGIQNQASIYVGLIVAFSSTMIVVKALSDKKEINSLHGRIIIGVLLVQDIIAIIALMLLSSDLSIVGILTVLGKGLLFVIIAIILSKAINPILSISARSHDLLLLVSISFLFLFILGSQLGGLSLIIGAFLAGVSLANSNYKTEIEGKITPLREFFAVIFFVTLGIQLRMISGESIYLLIALLALVIFVKPLIIMFLIRSFGYKKITSFLSGNALSQTSEFSLILVILGSNLGAINPELFSTLVLLTVLTMALTTYTISYEKRLFRIFAWPLNLFNKMGSRKENLEYHEEDGKKILIFGCHRMGSLFVKEFENNKKEIFVVDYNPEIIRSLMDKKIPCIYGDFANEEVFAKTDIKKAEIIISTIPDVEDNILLIKETRKLNRNVLIFIVATRISEAINLYKEGADYVILPQIIGGQKIFELIKKIKGNKYEVQRLKKEHLKYLNSIHNILY